MKLRFTIRDLLWLTAIAAMVAAYFRFGFAAAGTTAEMAVHWCCAPIIALTVRL